MKIAICDDEEMFLNEFRNKIANLEVFNKATIKTYSSSEKLHNDIKKANFDILFLDIDMPNMGGLELGKYIRSVNEKAIIVFVTNHQQYAIDAIDCEAMGYLMKDCPEEKFNETVNKIYRKYCSYNKTVALASLTDVDVIPVKSILYVEYVERKCYYHTTAGVYSHRQTIQIAARQLEDLGFYRIHRHLIVNFDKVKSIHYNKIVLTNNSVLDISRYRHSTVLKAFINYKKRVIF